MVSLPALLAVLACSTVQRQPPGAPPTRSSITVEDPGGDAADPEAAALTRQLRLPMGWAEDKDGELRVPMPDPANYKRVRYWAIEHFTGFRYGSDYHVMNVVLVQDLPADETHDSETCLRRAEKWGHPTLRTFEVKLGQAESAETTWQKQEVHVRSVDGYLDFGGERRRFSAAYAAYAAYPDACLVFGMAVPWGQHEDLAKQVRDRWVKDAVPRIRPMTKEKPVRKDD